MIGDIYTTVGEILDYFMIIWRCCVKCRQQHLGGEHRTPEGEWCDD